MKRLNQKEKKLLAFYLIWVMVNIFLWAMSGEGTNYFWPFEDIEDIEDYGAAEFFVYTLFPIGIYVVYRLLKNDDNASHSEMSIVDDIDNKSNNKPILR